MLLVIDGEHAEDGRFEGEQGIDVRLQRCGLPLLRLRGAEAAIDAIEFWRIEPQHEQGKRFGARGFGAGFSERKGDDAFGGFRCAEAEVRIHRAAESGFGAGFRGGGEPSGEFGKRVGNAEIVVDGDGGFGGEAWVGVSEEIGDRSVASARERQQAS